MTCSAFPSAPSSSLLIQHEDPNAQECRSGERVRFVAVRRASRRAPPFLPSPSLPTTMSVERNKASVQRMLDAFTKEGGPDLPVIYGELAEDVKFDHLSPPTKAQVRAPAIG